MPNLATMKTNQRTIKVYDSTHKLASQLSARYGVSMAALVELGIKELANKDELTLPPRDRRSRHTNARRVLA